MCRVLFSPSLSHPEHVQTNRSLEMGVSDVRPYARSYSSCGPKHRRTWIIGLFVVFQVQVIFATPIFLHSSWNMKVPSKDGRKTNTFQDSC